MEDNNDPSRPYTHRVVMTNGMGSTCDTNEVLFFRGWHGIVTFVIVLGFYESSVNTILILLYCSYMNEFFKYLKEIKLIHDLTKKFLLVSE